MNFSEALIELKKGQRLKRNGWNGKNLYVTTYVSTYCDDMFVIVNAITASVSCWVPSVSDLYAEDWEIFKY